MPIYRGSCKESGRILKKSIMRDFDGECGGRGKSGAYLI